MLPRLWCLAGIGVGGRKVYSEISIKQHSNNKRQINSQVAAEPQTLSRSHMSELGSRVCLEHLSCLPVAALQPFLLLPQLGMRSSCTGISHPPAMGSSAGPPETSALGQDGGIPHLHGYPSLPTKGLPG